MRNILDPSPKAVKMGARTLTGQFTARSLAAKFISLFERLIVAPTPTNLPPVPGVERDCDRYLTTDGVRLRYRDQGRGPPVLMAHGWTLDLEMWEPQVAALRDAFRLIRFDRRGFGLSSGRPSVARDIADLGVLCDHLAIERIALVGMSQGARAALGFAMTAPERVSCLILDGPPDYGNNPLPSDDDVPLDHYRGVVRERGMSAFRREWAAHPLLTLRTGDARMHEILNSMIMRYPGNDLVEPAVTDDAPVKSPSIDPIDVPVLVITGAQDLASRTQAADHLAGLLSNATRAVIPAAGHLPNLDNPNVYNTAMRTFLEQYAVPLTSQE
jgi:3-oxoadipate enol-lactonase